MMRHCLGQCVALAQALGIRLVLHSRDGGVVIFELFYAFDLLHCIAPHVLGIRLHRCLALVNGGASEAIGRRHSQVFVGGLLS